jgi:predicted nucleic acid-binding protein
MGLDVARKVSDLRATDRIKSPDAIQLSTAILYGATALMTNDKILERVKGVGVLILDKYLKY